MIITLTPNPAVDVTYRVPELRVGASHRVEDVRRRAGGKGVNTAGVLARTAAEHACVAAVDGALQTWWDEDLAERGVRSESVLVQAPWRTRTSVAIVTDDGTATLFNEAGEAPPRAVWADLAARVLALAGATASGARPVLAVCGSLPGTAMDDPPGELVRLASDVTADGGAVTVDGSGGWLREVLATRPALVKPNAHEAAVTTGEDDPLLAAMALARAGARAAMVSAGEDGVVLALEGGARWRARPGRVLRGNPTGAGDAATAAAAAYLTGQHVSEDPEAFLRQVVAWSGAAVLHPLAGDLDPDLLPELADAARVEQL